MNEKVLDIVNKIAKGQGPTRILIGSDGLAVSPKRTDIVPDIVFVRDDCWSLGCKFENRNIVESMWKYNWEYVVVLSKIEPTIFEYKIWKSIYDKQA